jgi:hypothetical protein
VPLPFASVTPDSAFASDALDGAPLASVAVTAVAGCDAAADVEHRAPGAAVPGAGDPSAAVAAGDAPGLPGDAVGEVPPIGAPPPFMRAPSTVEDWPPVSTLELTWTTACRRGATAIVAETMKATPAKTAAGRNRFALAASARHPRRDGALRGCAISDTSRGRQFPEKEKLARGKEKLARGQAQ